MMNEEQNRLLAEVRAYTVELTNAELTAQDCERLQLMVDMFRQIRADGAPDYPITEYIKRRYGCEKDNDGQSVIYLDDAPEYECPDLVAPYAVVVHQFPEDKDFPILDVEKQTDGLGEHEQVCVLCSEIYDTRGNDVEYVEDVCPECWV